jgi:ATP-binding cassette subfamily B protein
MSAEFLRGVGVFSTLDRRALEELAEHSELVSFTAGSRILNGDESWRHLYVVLSGQVRLIENRNGDQSNVLDVLSHGAHFGERSLIEEYRGEFSVFGLTDATFLRLSKDRFDAFLKNRPAVASAVREYRSYGAVRSFLSNSTIFSVLDPASLSKLAKSLTVRNLGPGEFLIREGDAAKDLFIVDKGRFKVFRNGSPEMAVSVQRGELLGEMALLAGSRRNATVVAETASSVFVVEENLFLDLVKQPERLRSSVDSLVERRMKSHAEAGFALDGETAVPRPVDDRITWCEPALTGRGSSGRGFGRLPVVRQQSVMDCGSACLATVCRYYGKRINLNRMRELARVGRSGASMLNLLRAAEASGFETVPMLSTYYQLSQNHLPAIVNWNGYHWIVVYRATEDRVTVADPGEGLRKLSKAEFLEGWTGYTLYLRPAARFAELEESQPALEQFRPYIRPFHRLMFDIALASMTIQILNLAIPMFAGFIIDEVVVRSDPSWLVTSLVAVSCVVLSSAAVAYFRQQLLLFVSLRVNVRLLSDFYKHVLSLPIPFFESRKVGDVVSRFEENIKITNFFTGMGLEFFIDAITAFLYVGLMLYYNVTLAIIAVAFLFFHAANLKFITPRLQQGYRDVFQKGAELQSHVIESLSGLRTIKTLGIERHIRWTWEHLFARHTNATFQTLKFGIASGLAGQIVNHASSIAILFLGAWMVLENRMTVGELVAFTVLVQNLTAPVTKVVMSWDTLQETLNAVERLNDVYDTAPESPPSPGVNLVVPPSLRGHLRLENVTFRYDQESANVLQNVTLEVKPGQRVAFVGRSGSGKSSIVKLLLGFYKPTTGQVYIDGFEAKKLWPPAQRRKIGVVPQDCFLFRGSVRENISVARPEAPLSEIMQAAKLASAHDFISGMPKGYETVIEENASNLSGGQRQRIAIARALLMNPSMLILDEATSALDNETERSVLRNIYEGFRGKTILSIAHRLSTVRNADLIVVLDRGNIVESGNHDQLVAERGLYYFLSTQQLNL